MVISKTNNIFKTSVNEKTYYKHQETTRRDISINHIDIKMIWGYFKQSYASKYKLDLEAALGEKRYWNFGLY